MAEQGKAAAFFDLDKTVIAISSTQALSGALRSEGILARRAMLRSAYAQATYQFGSAGAGQTERLRDALSRLIEGWDAAAVSRLAAASVAEAIAPQVFAEAAELIAEHKAAGRDVVIVSASGKELVEPIGRMLGADHTLATAMAVEDGRYTGEVAFFNYGAAKVEAMQRLAAEQGYDLAASYAYSDSITDLPMLEAVGHPAVVNPGRALKAEAEARGWEVIRFALPAPLKRRYATRTAWGGGVVLVPVVILVTIWAVRRHLRRHNRGRLANRQGKCFDRLYLRAIRKGAHFA
ncbi:MAG: HAD-IB family hydrolase [Bifidobacteriaceae bacterium]|jgi:HAD superfamily hydrolase (TIGR01490 family)|nr:HAD-IB family hydrolase [Bifidobacteriaceae bacterium]